MAPSRQSETRLRRGTLMPSTGRQPGHGPFWWPMAETSTPLQWGAYGAPLRVVVQDSLSAQVGALLNLSIPSSKSRVVVL